MENTNEIIKIKNQEYKVIRSKTVAETTADGNTNLAATMAECGITRMLGITKPNGKKLFMVNEYAGEGTIKYSQPVGI